MTKNADEVAHWFDALDALGGANYSREVYPGHPGLVVAGGELKRMTWGFPLTLKSKKTGRSLKPKPVNNTRADKLDSFMWRYSFEERRCLIPVSAWAEAEGPRGAKTRTWLSPPNAELFAIAGIWRTSDEWRDCYSMVMTDAVGDAREVHNRLPVLLKRDEFDIWLRGSPATARALCEPWQGGMKINRTSQPWRAI